MWGILDVSTGEFHKDEASGNDLVFQAEPAVQEYLEKIMKGKAHLEPFRWGPHHRNCQGHEQSWDRS